MSNQYSIKNCNCKSTANEKNVDRWPKWKFPKKKQYECSNTIYNYKSFDIFNRKEISFDKYRNKVLLVVNVASFCHFTYQYYRLNDLEAKLKHKGFHVLGFPCNQFGHQEPGDSAEEILNSLRHVRPGKDFRPNFQLLAKCDVNGENETDLYEFLKSSCSAPIGDYRSITNLNYAPYKSDDVRWNFEKFLIAKNGKVAMRIQHKVEPHHLEPFIECLLNNQTLNELKKCAQKEAEYD